MNNDFPLYNPNPVFSFTPDGTVLECNRAGEKLLNSWNEGAEKLSEENLQKALAESRVPGSSEEIQVDHKIYSYQVVSVTEQNIFMFFGSDVSRQKEAADRFYNLVNDIDEVMLLIDPHDMGRFKEVNNTAVRYLGYSREELLSMRVKDIEVEFPLQKKEQWEMHAKNLKKLGSKTMIGRHRRKDGTTYPVEVVIIYKEFGGKDYQMVLARDISERIKIEEEQQKMKLNLINASRLSSLGEMAGGIAHEINNPLAIISSSLEILQHCCQQNSPDKEVVKEVLERSMKTIGRINRIISGLKTVSRENDDFEKTKVCVKDVLTDVLGLCSEKFNSFGVKLLVDLESAEFQKEILCDRVLISQVLVNLIGNSFHAVEELNEKWVKIEIFHQPGQCLIEVSDSGKGIPPEIEEKIFNPFFTSKPVGKGTGLGLAISKSSIEKHGGILELVKDSKNTCFRITLGQDAQKDELNETA